MRSVPIVLLSYLATISSLTQAAEFQIDTRTALEIEGTIEPSYTSETDATGKRSDKLEDNDSTLQFEGRHQWSETAQGFFHIEYEWNFDEANDSAIDDLDSAWLGVQSRFGMLRVGTSDTLFEDEITELLDRFENAELSDEADSDNGIGEGNQVRYVTPDFGGVSFAVETKFEGNGEDNFSVGDPGFGESSVGLAATIRYDADQWGVVAGFDDRNASTIDIDGDGDADAFDRNPTMGIGSYVDISSLHLATRYAIERNRGRNSDVEYIGALSSYDYGKGSINLAVQRLSPDESRDNTEIVANVMHNIFDNLLVFIEAGRFDRVNEQYDRTEIGAIYSF